MSADARLRTHDVHLKLVAGCKSSENPDQAAFLGLVDAGAPAILRHVPDMPGLGFVSFPISACLILRLPTALVLTSNGHKWFPRRVKSGGRSRGPEPLRPAAVSDHERPEVMS